MRSGLWLPLLAALLAVPAASEAPEVPPTDIASKTDKQLLEYLDFKHESGTASACSLQVPIAQILVDRHPQSDATHNLLAIWQANCAQNEKDYTKALAIIEQAEQDHGLQHGESYGFALAVLADDGAAVVRRLRKLADAPDTLASLNRELFNFGARSAGRAKLDAEFNDACLEIGLLDEFADLDGALQQSIAYHALSSAAEHNYQAFARTMLGYVHDPSDFPELLAMRRYEALWPLIEQRVGEHFTAVSADYVSWSKTRFEAKPEDRDRFSAYAHALYFAGDFAGAVQLVSDWEARPDAFAAMEEGDSWAMNVKAYALDPLGRPADADAEFKRLIEVSQGKGWLVNYVINRASRLVGRGEWEAGLAASDTARQTSGTQGTTYAKMLVARDHVCALYKLGRAADAKDDLAFLQDQSGDTPALAAQGLLCAGREADAVKVMLAGLDREGTRDATVMALEPDELDLWYSVSVLPQTSALPASHPELAAALAKYARVVPAEYYPAASLIRRAAKVPAS